MTDEGRAILIVAALLSGASGSSGFVAGRVSAPVPPAEVRYVRIPVAVPSPVAPPAAAEVPQIEPVPPETPAAVTEPKPVAPEIEAAPVPKPRPKIDAKPKAPPKPKSRPTAPKKSLPSCETVKREYNRMSYAEQLSAYRRATAEEIAHGRRCLGF